VKLEHSGGFVMVSVAREFKEHAVGSLNTGNDAAPLGQFIEPLRGLLSQVGGIQIEPERKRVAESALPTIDPSG